MYSPHVKQLRGARAGTCKKGERAGTCKKGERLDTEIKLLLKLESD